MQWTEGLMKGKRSPYLTTEVHLMRLLKLLPDVNKGIVVATLGYWRQMNNGVVNSVSSNAFGDMGNRTNIS